MKGPISVFWWSDENRKVKLTGAIHQCMSRKEDRQMNINEQFEDFLAELGVEMEQPIENQFSGDSLPEISIFQASRDHYGVFYRLDIIDSMPQLRIMVPVEHGLMKMEMYLVRMSSRLPLNAWFSGVS